MTEEHHKVKPKHEEFLKLKGDTRYTAKRNEFRLEEETFQAWLFSEWFNTVQESEVHEESFLFDLSDGVVICRVLTQISASGLKKGDFYDPVKNEFQGMENLRTIRTVAKEKLFFPNVFKDTDFLDNNAPPILSTCFYIAKAASKHRHLKKQMPKELRQHVAKMPDLVPPTRLELVQNWFFKVLGIDKEDDDNDQEATDADLFQEEEETGTVGHDAKPADEDNEKEANENDDEEQVGEEPEEEEEQDGDDHDEDEDGDDEFDEHDYEEEDKAD